MENSKWLTFCDDIISEWTGEQYNNDAVEKYAELYPGKRIVVDIFPNTIMDGEKYYQVDVCYKRWCEGDIDKKTFLDNEKKYLDFIKTLWLYNTVDICYDLSFSNYFRKGSKKRLKYIIRISKQNVLHDVQEWCEMEDLLKLALREAGHLWIYFKEWEVYAEIFGVIGNLILFKEEDALQRIIPILNHNLLYVLNRET